ncbi:hypothetical protein [Pseudonocardia sp. TRM90224]|uniref:hypothetical protein n=1 Tax=Pseudonocardia sp. TRM90224 TaxID=2812678 RepID=UPI001E36A79F|nr:hypothetical protein [Pseudonocardia sp. TRM90224]
MGEFDLDAKIEGAAGFGWDAHIDGAGLPMAHAPAVIIETCNTCGNPCTATCSTQTGTCSSRC